MKYAVSSIAAALLLFATAAQAHSHLESSKPAEGSVINASPGGIELNFSESVRITALSIQKGDEKKQPLGPLPDKPAQKVSVAVPTLAPGKYVVSYRVVGDDNHVMSGTLNFTVSASQAMDHKMGEKMDPKMDHMNAADHH
jgi:methionine-rich copper-binding protein CopC